jgi:hypothetical protein
MSGKEGKNADVVTFGTPGSPVIGLIIPNMENHDRTQIAMVSWIVFTLTKTCSVAGHLIDRSIDKGKECRTGLLCG